MGARVLEHSFAQSFLAKRIEARRSYGRQLLGKLGQVEQDSTRLRDTNGQIEELDTVQAIAARHEVHPNQVSAWKRQAVEGLDEVFSQPGSRRGGDHAATIRDLHAKIGELTVERDFFLRGLAR